MSSTVTNPALLPPGGLHPGAPTPAPAGAGGAHKAGAGARTGGPAPGRSPSGPAFAEVLQKAAGGEPLNFSRHALERVARRGIELDAGTLARLHEGVGRAAGKGSRDSLVLVDGTAFVVAVNSRTVVTAVDHAHMREHVFTNLDSAVIA